MLCANCGKPAEDSSLFCPYCGTEIPKGPENTPADEPEVKAKAAWPFCRKCGAKIPEDSIFCPACGESAEIAPHEDIPDDEPPVENNPKKIFARIALVIFVLAGLMCVVGLIRSLNNICDYSGCSSQRASQSNFCSSHECGNYDCSNPTDTDERYCPECACAAENCTNSRDGESKYCIPHTCIAENCLEQKVTRGSYCTAHTCDEPDCTNKAYGKSTKCYADLPSLREKLKAQEMDFDVTYNEGVEFTFVAINQTGKTIKYVRFKLYLRNAVGDPVYDKATGKNYFEVEIVGPTTPGNTISIRNKFLGYCNGELQRVDVEDIVIIYTDNTTDTGTMNYYITIPR